MNESAILGINTTSRIWTVKSSFDGETWQGLLVGSTPLTEWAGQSRDDIAIEMADLMRDWVYNDCAWFCEDHARQNCHQDSWDDVASLTPLEAADKVIRWRDEYLLGAGGLLITEDNWWSQIRHRDQQQAAKQALAAGDTVIYLEDVADFGRVVRILNIGNLYMVADNGPSIITTAKSFDQALERYNTGEVVAP